MTFFLGTDLQRIRYGKVNFKLVTACLPSRLSRVRVPSPALLTQPVSVQAVYKPFEDKQAALGHQVPKVAGQILLAGLVGIRQLPAERLYAYEKDRIAQEEHRIQQDLIRCHGDAAALQAQISVIVVEFSLL